MDTIDLDFVTTELILSALEKVKLSDSPYSAGSEVKQLYVNLKKYLTKYSPDINQNFIDLACSVITNENVIFPDSSNLYEEIGNIYLLIAGTFVEDK